MTEEICTNGHVLNAVEETCSRCHAVKAIQPEAPQDEEEASEPDADNTEDHSKPVEGDEPLTDDSDDEAPTANTITPDSVPVGDENERGASDPESSEPVEEVK